MLPKRCANYLVLWLASDPAYRRETYTEKTSGPDYPAVWYYDANTDQSIWIEVRYPSHVRDYALGYPDNLNDAAMALARHG